MNIFLKRESRTEDAQHCQPCGHSPGSRALSFGGLLPSRKALHQNPALSSKLAACLSSPTHPLPGPGSSNWRTTSTATSGVRSPIIFNASLQDAQYAAGAQCSADRSPSPPMRIGNVDNCLDSTSSWLGIPWRRDLPVSQDSRIVGHTTINRLTGRHGAHGVICSGGCALQQQLPCALQVRNGWDCFPQNLFLRNAFFHLGGDVLCGTNWSLRL